MHERELEYATIHQQRCGCQLIYQPATFRIELGGVEYRYTPDFYCPKTLTFIEVAGTRQAYALNKSKIEATKQLFPQLKLDVFDAEENAVLSYQPGYRSALPIPKAYRLRKEIEYRQTVREKLIQCILAHPERGFKTKTAHALGTTPQALNTLIYHRKTPIVKTCAKIEAYLKSLESNQEIA